MQFPGEVEEVTHGRVFRQVLVIVALSAGWTTWLGKAGHERRETSNLQAAGNRWDYFFFLWISEAGCVERLIISQLPLK